jgi:hypothetical protein
LLDVPIEKFFTDFAILFGDTENDTEKPVDHFTNTYHHFEDALSTMDYDIGKLACPQDNHEYETLYNIWYFQSLHFGNLISEGNIDFVSKALNDTTDREKFEFVTTIIPANIDFVAKCDNMLLEKEEKEQIRTITTCGKCGQVLRIPIGINLRLTCSKCKCVFVEYSTKTGPFECGCCAALFGSFAMGKAGNKRWKEMGPKAIFKKMGVDPSSKEASTIMSGLVVCEWEDTIEEACGHATIGFCQKCGIPLCREHVL